MKKKLTLQDFADYIAQSEGVDKTTAEAFVRAFFDIIEEGLIDDKFVKIKGFGTFKLMAVSERESVNINTGERFQISGHTKVSFTPDSTMKELVNRPFAHFEAVDLNDDTDTKEFEVIDEEMEEEELDEGDSADIDNTATDDSADNSDDQDQDTADTADTAETPNTNEEQEPAVTATTPVTTAGNAQNEPEQSGIIDNDNELETAKEVVDAEDETPAEPDNSKGDDEHCEGQELQPAAQTDTAEQAHDEEEKDIVVTTPAPINNQTASSAGTDNQNTNASVGYTYSEVPGPHKRNWWKVTTAILGILILMAASYFAGYYRMLCPNCNDNIDEPIAADSLTTNALPVPPQAQPQPADTTKSSSPTDTVVKVTTQPEPTQTEAAAPKTENAEAAKPAKADHAKEATTRPTTHKVKVGDNVYRIARKYYGSDEYAEKIIKANHLKDANNITIGMDLKLP